MNNPSPSPKTKLWVRRSPGYLKLCADADGGRNVGIIDAAGWINAKSGPVSIISREASFTASPSGASRCDGGSGYRGWAYFGSLAGALTWLRERFDLREA
jgi:hypothetical protein